MTEIYRTIPARRTVRDFEPWTIEWPVLERVLGAGLRAPTYDAKDGRRFIVAEDEAAHAELVCGLWWERTEAEIGGDRRLLVGGVSGAAGDVFRRASEAGVDALFGGPARDPLLPPDGATA